MLSARIKKPAMLDTTPTTLSIEAHSSEELKMGSERPSALDIDTGRARIGIKTLFTLMIGTIVLVASVVASVVTAWSGVATKSEVTEKIKPVADAAAVAIAERNVLDKRVDRVETGMKHIETAVGAQGEDTKYIRARIDFMMEQKIIEAQENHQARRRFKRPQATCDAKQPPMAAATRCQTSTASRTTNRTCAKTRAPSSHRPCVGPRVS